MLVVPDYWGFWPLERFPQFTRWLRRRAGEGVEMLLHGYFHRDSSDHRSRLARWKATAWTDREGEFLGLARSEAASRLVRGRALLEGLLDQEVTGFVAPAWLYGAGARQALADLGFRIAEDHLKVWAPLRDRVLHRGPVISYASRSTRRAASSLAWSRAATVLLRRQEIVRVAIHPGDFDLPVLRRELSRVLDTCLSYRTPIRYREVSA